MVAGGPCAGAVIAQSRWLVKDGFGGWRGAEVTHDEVYAVYPTNGYNGADYGATEPRRCATHTQHLPRTDYQ